MYKNFDKENIRTPDHMWVKLRSSTFANKISINLSPKYGSHDTQCFYIFTYDMCFAQRERKKKLYRKI